MPDVFMGGTQVQGRGLISRFPETETFLPAYRCHKLVRAAKISRIEDGRLYFETGGTALEVISLTPKNGYFEKHEPKVGGYYVRYEDGYESWSPAEAFEDGYHRESY